MSTERALGLRDPSPRPTDYAAGYRHRQLGNKADVHERSQHIGKTPFTDIILLYLSPLESCIALRESRGASLPQTDRGDRNPVGALPDGASRTPPHSRRPRRP
jgi:hypothetical protein